MGAIALPELPIQAALPSLRAALASSTAYTTVTFR